MFRLFIEVCGVLRGTFEISCYLIDPKNVNTYFTETFRPSMENKSLFRKDPARIFTVLKC